ncbi:MAG: hypothetical protein K2M94_07185 [Paramuribaculum sp.]|nr:hypothetical protein [Paramuribaculum sp.]
MNTHFLSSEMLHTFVWIALLMVADYVAVLIAVAIDLRSALRKLRRDATRTTSRGYRRTVTKLSNYYILLLVLSVVDTLLIMSVTLLQATMQWHLPAFPLLTTVGAFAMTLIEAKSVMENSQRPADYADAAKTLRKIIENEDLRATVDTLRRLMESHPSDSSSGPH